MYILMESVPYECDVEVASGNKKEIKEALRKRVTHLGIYYDDFYLVMESDISIEELRAEIRKEAANEIRSS